MPAKSNKNLNGGKAMKDHKETKHANENADAVEKAKKVTTPKDKPLSRKQIMERRGLDMAEIADASKNPELAKQTLLAYETFFQIEDSKDFLSMIQDVNKDEKTITLKTGMVLPVVAKDGGDLLEFLEISNALMDIDGISPNVNFIKFCIDNPDFAQQTKMFFYALHQLVGYGRKCPTLELRDIDASTCGIGQEDFHSAGDLVDRYVEDPEAVAPEFKAFLMGLAPEAFEAFSELFTRESFKKLGLTFTSAAEGEDVPYTSTQADAIAYLAFDTWGTVISEADEADEDEEPADEVDDEDEEPAETEAEMDEEETGSSKFVEDDIEEDEDDIYVEEDED